MSHHHHHHHHHNNHHHNSGHQVRQLLEIHSHGSKLPPLDPPADISFDVSRVPNPPANLRYSHDGRHARLKKWLLQEPAFVNLLHSAGRSVRDAVDEKRQDYYSKRDGGSLTPGLHRGRARGATFEGKQEGGGAVGRQTASFGIPRSPTISVPPPPRSREGSPIVEDQYDQKTGLPPHRVLRISSFCVAGHHRSVAFAEELAELRWPEGWQVRVYHRDLGRDVGWYKRHPPKQKVEVEHESTRGTYEMYRWEEGRAENGKYESSPRRPPTRESMKSEGRAVADRVLEYLR